jgi:hypothetical protein
MAKKQTRRSVSLNRNDYEAAKLEAARRGMTLSGLVESGLAAIGVAVVAHTQQTVELAQVSAARRAESLAARQAGRNMEPRPLREPQMHGDQVADVCGFA